MLNMKQLLLSEVIFRLNHNSDRKPLTITSYMNKVVLFLMALYSVSYRDQYNCHAVLSTMYIRLV